MGSCGWDERRSTYMGSRFSARQSRIDAPNSQVYSFPSIVLRGRARHRWLPALLRCDAGKYPVLSCHSRLGLRHRPWHPKSVGFLHGALQQTYGEQFLGKDWDYQGFSNVFFLFPSPPQKRVKERGTAVALPRHSGTTLFITLGWGACCQAERLLRALLGL